MDFPGLAPREGDSMFVTHNHLQANSVPDGFETLQLIFTGEILIPIFGFE